jgi:hypothetical protein
MLGGEASAVAAAVGRAGSLRATEALNDAPATRSLGWKRSFRRITSCTSCGVLRSASRRWTPAESSPSPSADRSSSRLALAKGGGCSASRRRATDRKRRAKLSRLKPRLLLASPAVDGADAETEETAGDADERAGGLQAGGRGEGTATGDEGVVVGISILSWLLGCKSASGTTVRCWARGNI